MAAKRPNALAAFVSTLKAADKAKRSISDHLKSIIDDYTGSEACEKYFLRHAADVAKYIKDEPARTSLFRASGAGKCFQKQAFDIVSKQHGNDGWALPHIKTFVASQTVVVRPPRQMRALHNGVFGHARWHLIFDALHELGIVETLYSESLRYSEFVDLSGTIDRVIAFEFEGRRVVMVLDFKTIKHEYWSELKEPQPDHTAQQHAYDLFGYNADVWGMLYESKNTHELKIYDRPYDGEITSLLLKNYRLTEEWMNDYIAGRAPTAKLSIETSWCNYCEWKVPCAVLHPERPDLVVNGF